MKDFGLTKGIISEEGKKRISVLPVSIIEISRQISGRRTNDWRERSGDEFSHFPTEVSRLCYETYLKNCNKIFDPFAGWGERGFWAKQYEKEYVGFDISQESIKWAKEKYRITNILADSMKEKIPKFDGLITCPPYYNKEIYSELGIENAPSWDSFVEDLELIFKRCYQSGDLKSIFCIMVGDFRVSGLFCDMTFEVHRMFKEFGAEVIDTVVISRFKTTKIAFMLQTAIKKGVTLRVHEDLLVFKKT